ncbi:MAG: hypothetical protein JNK35_06950 [Phycisphaerae bacterium]|nr:hypothetical protein [Phycisphaerae bacterium]
MLTLLTVLSLLLTALIVGLLFWQFWSRGEPLLSWRNFFLLGFMQFYTVAVAHWSSTQAPSPVYTPRLTMLGPLALSMVVFLALFLFSWRWGFNWNWPAKIIPRARLPVTTSAMLVCTVAVAFIAVLTVVLARGGTVGDNILFIVRVPLATAATGCAVCLVLANPRNPVWWGLALAVGGFALILSTVGSIDRRNFLSVLFIVGWMWYYLSLRYQPRVKLISKLAVVMAISFVMLATYNAFRQDRGFGADMAMRTSQFIENAKKGPNFSARNIIDGILLQDTPVCTMAIMENYGDQWEYLPFHGIVYYFTNPIPRAWYPEKPEAVGVILQNQLKVPANLGVGCIGHGWAEAHWWGVIYYAVGLGVICGVADRLARRFANDPFFLVTIGCSLGNVLGLARGETSLFLVIVTAGFVASQFIFWAARVFLGPYMRIGDPLVIGGRLVSAPVDDVTGLSLPEPHFDDSADPSAGWDGESEQPWAHDDESEPAPYVHSV